MNNYPQAAGATVQNKNKCGSNGDSAAAPFLQGVKVKDLSTLERLAKLADYYDLPDENGPFPDIQDVMVTVGDLRKVRKLFSELSAVEVSPSPRAQALEEAAVLEALEECETYFDDRADADHDGNGFVPNEEMRILVSVRAAIRALSSQPVAEGEYEIDYEVICNGDFVAGSSDLADAKHYAAVYAQDGPVEIIEARTYRRPLPASPGASATRPTGGSNAD